MKIFAFFLVAIVLVMTRTAQAQTIDLRTITCKEAVTLSKDTLDLVSAWIDGHLSDDDDAESMVVDFSETDAEDLRNYCQQHPKNKLIEAAENLE